MIVSVSAHLTLTRGVSSMVYFDPISVLTVLLVLLRFTNGSQSHWMVYMCGYDVTRSFCAITGNFWPLSQPLKCGICICGGNHSIIKTGIW